MELQSESYVVPALVTSAVLRAMADADDPARCEASDHLFLEVMGIWNAGT